MPPHAAVVMDPPGTRATQPKDPTTRMQAAPSPPLNTSNPFQPLMDPNPDPLEYEVESITATRITHTGVKLFYIKWKGHASHHNTWEEEQALKNAPQILSDFLTQDPDSPPPLTRCQVKLCLAAAAMEFPRCQHTPRSQRCAKHSCLPCGPGTHCPCQSKKRQLGQPTSTITDSPSHTPRTPPALRRQSQYPPAASPKVTNPLPPNPTPIQPPQPPNPAPLSPPGHMRRKRQRSPAPTPTRPAPASRSQRPQRPKRPKPDSAPSPPPTAKRIAKQTSTTPSLGRNKRGSKRVAKPRTRKKKTPHRANPKT